MNGDKGKIFTGLETTIIIVKYIINYYNSFISLMRNALNVTDQYISAE